MAALKKGYHILLEKPISKDRKECLQLAAAAGWCSRHVIVAHVLRYTDFFTQVKRLVETGTIGEVVSIHLIEKVAFWHHAHSFEGNWRRRTFQPHDSGKKLSRYGCAALACRKRLPIGCLSVLFTHFTEKKCSRCPRHTAPTAVRRVTSLPVLCSRFYLDGKDSWQASILRRVVSQDTGCCRSEALKSGP